MLVIYKYLIALDKIIASSERDINEEMLPIDGIESMPEPLKTLAGNISVTQDEMKKAVDEAIKGEKMKTELITNVSHDLKTPLTSIISYVDLLKKCDIDDVSAQKYIDVLDEKSIRLKRLIEDLVEASKASSGAVTFNKMKVNLYELTIQAITEMDDMFEKNNLEVILEPTENPPMIFADSQKTWRIIDNLLSNSKKYSLEGTRVYVSLSSDENFGSITIKNTSRDALNINPDELTERFVRGDSSRTREGSGLGLSIAKDLCNLQGGKLDISIDGDLFKVTVNMPLYK
ncbi:MAG: HAMP domain-containing sensor histidine kinase [Oscillospiraceae bacterium]